jgi:hypothetical protein
VQFVDHKDGFRSRDVLKSFKPVTISVSAEIGQEIDHQDALVRQKRRDLTVRNALGEAFHDGALAHAGLADEDRIAVRDALGLISGIGKNALALVA